MTDTHVVSALKTKRAQVAGQIESLQGQLRQATIDLDHVEAALRLFDPEVDLAALSPRKVAPVLYDTKGDTGRVILETLRTAMRPLTTDQVCEAVMVARALSDPAQGCGRAPKCAVDYQSRISGPLFDRIDLHVEVAAVAATDMALPAAAEGNAEVAMRVAAARDIQRARYAELPIRTNAEADGELLNQVAGPDAAGTALLTEAAERMRLSARGYGRVLRVARTIADLAGTQAVARSHIAEALSYRRMTHLN